MPGHHPGGGPVEPGIEVLASTLGGDIVTVGAVERALDHVREHALETVPAALG